MRRQDLPWRLSVLIGAVWLGGLAWLAYSTASHALWTPREAGNALLAVTLLVVAGLYPLPVAPRVKANVTTAPLFAAALLLPPGNAALVAVVGGILYQAALRFTSQRQRHPWYKYLFNVGETALSTGLASLVFRLLAGPEAGIVSPAVLPAAVVMYVVNTGLVSIAASLQAGVSPVRVWWDGNKENGPAELALYSFGFLGAVATSQSPWLVVAFLMPVGVVYMAFSRLAKSNAQLADALSRLQELQGHMVAQSKLASTGAISLDLSHQVKNPLFALIGRLETLQRTLPPDGPSHRSVESALQSAWKIRDLLNNLLAGGRGEFVVLDPMELMDETLGMARLADHPGVHFRRRYDSDLPPVRGNRVLLREALTNVVMNALEVSPKDGEIAVTISRDGGTVVIGVTDWGPGISPEQMEHLFEPFRTTKPNGLGLGLFAAKHIVEMHKGTVTAHSPEEGGTCFMIRLATAEAADAGGGISLPLTPDLATSNGIPQPAAQR